jgi:predicted HicB family RNase H-like nuclease
MSEAINAEATVRVGPYKGYAGQAAYDGDAELFHGEVSGTADVITFQGRTVKELTKAFRDSVDDYLEFCASRNEEPEKPMSGKFVVRVEPEVHRKLAARAKATGRSLNGLLIEVLGQAADSAPSLRKPIPREESARRGDAPITKTRSAAGKKGAKGKASGTAASRR